MLLWGKVHPNVPQTEHHPVFLASIFTMFTKSLIYVQTPGASWILFATLLVGTGSPLISMFWLHFSQYTPQKNNVSTELRSKSTCSKCLSNWRTFRTLTSHTGYIRVCFQGQALCFQWKHKTPMLCFSESDLNCVKLQMYGVICRYWQHERPFIVRPNCLKQVDFIKDLWYLFYIR